MSRIGKRPVPIPDGVTVDYADSEVKVKGPKGSLVTALPDAIQVEIAEGEVRFTRPDDRKHYRALHGLARALTANMVTGVTDGFSKELEIQGVGYRAEVKGKALVIRVGYSHPVEMPVPEGLSVSVDANTKIVVEGIDKQLVGQFAATVRSVRPPEPYKGKGIRYRGERVRRKVGKTGAV
ncbi:MAG: 50S ribosomal protein L6 [Myxococcota bacterium]